MKVVTHHVESLDVFRGLTIAAMILVNNPGDWNAVFPQLQHAYWTGCTVADLVFPCFLFIMGVAMPFAFARRRERGHEARHLVRRIATRVTLLIGLGLIINAVASWPAVGPLRIPGVLQRIALAYLIASLVVLRTGMWGSLAAAAALLAGHWVLLTSVPFGGHPPGTLTPEHNLARYLDEYVFGRHAWTTSTDPEGLLGTLPAAATTLLGASIGHVMRGASDEAARLRSLVFTGFALLAIGWCWSFWLPLSKPLWTGSYAVLTAGLAALILGVLYWMVDGLGWRAWARPFMWLGVNPLAVYFCSEIVGHVLDDAWLPHGTGHTTPKTWLVWSWLAPALSPRGVEWASLVFAVAFVTFWTAVAGALHERHIRVQV